MDKTIIREKYETKWLINFIYGVRKWSQDKMFLRVIHARKKIIIF